MKKLIIMILAIFSVSAAAAFAQSGEGSSVYFMMERVVENDDGGYEHTLLADPMKVYENGFYNYSGQFIKFEMPAATVADAVDGILSYYKKNSELMSEASYAVLNDYYFDRSFFNGFDISGIDGDYYDTPTSIIYKTSSDGLASYNISDKDGTVFRLVFGKDVSIFWTEISNDTLPTSDELICAMGDYCEALAETGVSKAATDAYADALGNFFDPNMQDELCTVLTDSLAPSSGKITIGCEHIGLIPSDSTVSGSLDASIDNGTGTAAAAVITLAIYNSDNRPVYVASQPATLAVGKSAVSFTNISASCNGGFSLKIFAWDSFGGFVPLADAFSAELE